MIQIYKYIAFFSIVLGLGITQTSALELLAEENITITEEINSDIIIAGGRVDIENNINQDLIIAAGEISIESPIQQDFTFAAGEVRIEEKIFDDVRGIAGLVIIENDVEGDVILAGGDIRIKKNATIKGDLIVASGRLELDGNVLGNVKIAGEEFELNGVIHGNAEIILDEFINNSQSGTIIGDLYYRAENKIPLLEESVIGEVIYETAVFKEQFKKDAKDMIYSAIILKILFVFVFSTFLYFFFNRFYKRSAEILSKKAGKSFLYGLLTIILTPVFIVLFFVSIIGIPVGFLLLFWYILVLVFLNVINTTVITAWLVGKYKFFNKVYIKIILILLLSIVFVSINGLDIIIGFFTIGSIIILKKEILDTIRNLYK